MGYVDSMLADDETVLMRATVTRWCYLNPCNLIIFALIARACTEMAVTSRRLILKRGLIRRDTSEMPLNRVESVNIRQGILGRIFGFGDVIATGTGDSALAFSGIDAPLDFKKAIDAALRAL